MTQLNLNWRGGDASYEVNFVESDIWKAVGQTLEQIPVPNDLEVEVGGQKALLELTQRGTVKGENGSRPSLFVKEVYNNIAPEPSLYEEKYLLCVNQYGNNYKFYRIVPNNIGDKTVDFKCEYGRVGDEGGRFGARWTQSPYPSYLYWIRYFEKLSKGYEDKSSICLAKEEKPKKKVKKKKVKEDSNPTSKELYKLLLGYARRTVQRTLAHPQQITQAMIDESKRLVEELKDKTDLKEFNDTLLEIMILTPRSVSDVAMWLAKSTTDFAYIIDREEGLVNAMTVVLNDGIDEVDTTSISSFGPLGINVEKPTDDEKKMISSLINNDMRPHIKDIYMVTPTKHQKRLEDYCERNNISEHKLLLHGSRKENWLSITENGLLLPQHNNARKCGAGLGYGIYFGNNSKKCSHYTFDGDGTMVIGVFDVAYGKPKKILDTSHNCYQNHDQAELDREGKNCLHYHRKGCDWADEIVFYNENAMCMKALVVLDC